MSEPEPTGLNDFSIRYPRLADIVQVVSDETGIPVIDILSERQDKPTTFARQVFCWTARKTTTKSLPVIGRYINRDHKVVLYSNRRICDLRAVNPSIRKTTDAVLTKATA